MKAFRLVQNTFLLMLFSITIVFASPIAQKSTQKNPQQRIRESLTGTKITSISKTTIVGLYQVVAGHNVFYSDASGHFLVFGHIYDLKNQKDLTQRVKNALVPKPHVSWNMLPKHPIVSGHSALKLAVFLDPNCPYCRALEKELAHLKQIEVHYYLMPLGSIHPESPYQVQQIWCSQNRLSALKKLMSGKALTNKPTCHLKNLKIIARFIDQHHFEYTPTLIRQDGSMLFGYVDKVRLLTWLHQGQNKRSQKNTTKAVNADRSNKL